MDPEPISFLAFILFSSGVILSLVVLLLLIVSSGLISGSEVAFYSLTPSDMESLKNEDNASAKRILALKKKPRTLLATILISNNFINIAIVILSTYVIEELLGQESIQKIGEWLFEIGLGTLFTASQLGYFFYILITVVGVTSVLVLFGEIAPKIYANLNNLSFAKFMSLPLTLLNTVLNPLSRILVKWSEGLEHRIAQSSNYTSGTSKEDIDAAIELTVSADNETNSEEQADILKGIVKFGDVAARQIMRSRVDVTAFDIEQEFGEVLSIIKESGYSRIPVYKEDLDNIVGILYVKDLLGYTDRDNTFAWQELIRPTVLYVPESKKIDDVLKEFQSKRTHMGVVVDEYGGTAGLVTLEDVMEEVIGDIKDEFDEQDEIDYVEISPGNYVFEGKTLLNDVCRIIGVDTDYFDEVRGESDSLAGLILEVSGDIPKKDKKINYKNTLLKIVSVSKRRIEKIAVSID